MNIKKILVSAAAGALMFGAMIVPAFANAPNGNYWKVYDYNRSGQAFRSRVPTDLATGGVEFNFLSTPDTAYLLTGNKQSGLLGDLTGKTLTANVGVNPAGTCVQYYGGPSGCSTASVRLFFQTSTPGSFDPMDYWWFTGSGTGEAALSNMATATLTGNLANPSQWSDWDGHNATYDPAHTAAFNAAVANVQSIGLSYGGGSGYANGVGVTDGPASFDLTSFTVTGP